MKTFLKLTFVLMILTLYSCTIQSEAKEQIKIPDEIQQSCEKYGEEYGICPELLEAICWHETRCRPELENAGCVGITQINPKYFKKTMELLGIDDLYDYDQNIHVCAYTIAEYAEQESDLYCVLMMWNCSPEKGRKLFYQDIFTKYAVQVSEESYELERLHNK